MLPYGLDSNVPKSLANLLTKPSVFLLLCQLYILKSCFNKMYYCNIVLLYYCIIVLLYYCIIVLLYYCIIMVPCRYTSSSLAFALNATDHINVRKFSYSLMSRVVVVVVVVYSSSSSSSSSTDHWAHF